jgi:hypothetical protein
VKDGWLSVQEAADRCGVAYRTLLAMVRRGEVTAQPSTADRKTADLALVRGRGLAVGQVQVRPGLQLLVGRLLDSDEGVVGPWLRS